MAISFENHKTYFVPPTEGVSLGIGYLRRGLKNRMMGLLTWNQLHNLLFRIMVYILL